MDTKLIFGVSPVALIVLLAFLHSETHGNPIESLGKPPNCPYGKCYIDRCRRICNCVPKEGHITCTRETNFLREAMNCPKESNLDGNCPLGKTFKEPTWPDNFLCYCNNDASQTYECFDLSKQTSADAQDLRKSLQKTVQ